jgi:succinoglycan biosynthesis transport protein ExoP
MPHDMRSPNPDESFLLRTIEILRRRKAIALLAFLAVFVSAVSFARYLPDLYRANAVVLVERQLPETFVRAAVSGELDSRLHVIKQEVLSRTRITDLVRRFDLYAAQRARGDMESVLDRMRQDIDVEQTGPEQMNGRIRTVAFNLTFTGASRETVAEVTNAIAAFYIAQNNQMRSQEATRTTEFLKAQLESAKTELEKQEALVRSYTSRNAGQMPQQVDVNLATLERLNTQLRLNGERQIRTIEAREKLLENVPPTVSVGTLGELPPSPSIARLEKLKQDLKATEAKGTDKHPDVRRLRDEIAQLEREIESAPASNGNGHSNGNGNGTGNGHPQPAAPVASRGVRARGVDTFDAELERLKADEATLRQTIAAAEQRLESVPFRQNEFAQISRDHQAAKDVYDSLMRRHEEAQVSASMETEQQGERFRILEAAVAPEGPSAPNRPRLLILGFLLAILCSGLAVLVAEQFDTSFHTVDDLRHFTSVPVLGAIPRIGSPSASGRLRTAVATASVIAALSLIVAVSAWLARGNEEVVRLLARN